MWVLFVVVVVVVVVVIAVIVVVDLWLQLDQFLDHMAVSTFVSTTTVVVDKSVGNNSCFTMVVTNWFGQHNKIEFAISISRTSTVLKITMHILATSVLF